MSQAIKELREENIQAMVDRKVYDRVSKFADKTGMKKIRAMNRLLDKALKDEGF